MTKIVFFGSDEFAAGHLEKLIAAGRCVLACVAPPDVVKGRGMNLAVPPVKASGLRFKIPVLQPERFDNVFIDQLKNFQADLFVVIAYGRILPKQVLEIPKVFSVNVHASLLPSYRGAAPINWAIINGDKVTGLSIIRMNEKLDAGEILFQQRIEITDRDTSVTLKTKMAEMGRGLLLKTIEAVEKREYTLTPQDEKFITFAPKLAKETGHIDWNKEAIKIHNLARGLLPWPSAYTFFNGKQLKILETEVVSDDGQLSAGKVSEIHKDGFVVSTGKGAILIKKVHLADSTEMDAQNFLRGHKMELGFSFV